MAIIPNVFFNQSICQDIKNHYKQQCCAMCGVRGNSENTQIEVDHKDGRKDDSRVSDLSTQAFDDFQALCKACNDKKRQICKKCKETGYRFDARKIPGNHYSFYEGRLNMMVVWAVINMTPYNTGKLVMIGYTMKGIKRL